MIIAEWIVPITPVLQVSVYIGLHLHRPSSENDKDALQVVSNEE